jgi:hypothetical protein
VSLPDPPKIVLVEPNTELYRVTGIPPAPVGGRRPAVALEVEIDDGVGDEPDNILYVKAIAATGALTLNRERDYGYAGEVQIVKGSNRVEILTEDIAGNKTTKVLTIAWTD